MLSVRPATAPAPPCTSIARRVDEVLGRAHRLLRPRGADQLEAPGVDRRAQRRAPRRSTPTRAQLRGDHAEHAPTRCAARARPTASRGRRPPRPRRAARRGARAETAPTAPSENCAATQLRVGAAEQLERRAPARRARRRRLTGACCSSCWCHLAVPLSCRRTRLRPSIEHLFDAVKPRRKRRSVGAMAARDRSARRSPASHRPPTRSRGPRALADRPGADPHRHRRAGPRPRRPRRRDASWSTACRAPTSTSPTRRASCSSTCSRWPPSSTGSATPAGRWTSSTSVRPAARSPGRSTPSAPGSRQLAVELDTVLPELVRGWFDLPRSPALRIRAGDARAELSRLPDASADVVVRDVFAGDTTPDHVRTREMVAQVARVLRPGGVYLVNCADRPPLAGARAEVRHAASRRFADVAVDRRAGAPARPRLRQRRRSPPPTTSTCWARRRSPAPSAACPRPRACCTATSSPRSSRERRAR